MKRFLKYLKYFFYFILVLIIGLVALTFVPGFTYLRKLAYYRKSEIDDYKLFANHIVKAAKNPQIWKKSKDYNTQTIPTDKLKEMEKYKTIAFLVIQDGKIKFEKYWENYNEDAKSGSFSMAKSIVSLLIGIAIEEGKIKNVEQKAGDFLPAFAQGEKAKIRIKDLLTMSSGLAWSEAYSNPFATVAAGYFGEDITELIDNLKVSEAPGVNNSYKSGDTQILGMILMQVYQKPLSELVSEKIWQAIGAKNDALWSLDKENGTEKAFCCFNSNARDFARLGQLVLQKGKWNDKQIVPEKYILEATSPATYLKNKEGKPVQHYGYQFWIAYHKNMTIPSFRGVLGQYIMVIPAKNAIVVRLGHTRGNAMIRYFPEDWYMYADVALAMLD